MKENKELEKEIRQKTSFVNLFTSQFGNKLYGSNDAILGMLLAMFFFFSFFVLYSLNKLLDRAYDEINASSGFSPFMFAIIALSVSFGFVVILGSIIILRMKAEPTAKLQSNLDNNNIKIKEVRK